MTDETARRFYALALELLERSREKQLKWNESPTGFWVTLGGHPVEIRSVDDDGRHPYRLAIESPQGDIDWLDTGDEPFEGLPPDVEWRDQIADLYKIARRQGAKTEQVLDDVFGALERGDFDVPF